MRDVSRRWFLKAGSLSIGAWVLSGCTFAKRKSVGPKLTRSRPNIILVITDDQGYGDLSCHGHPYLKTPNLDALHAKSLRLTNFHVSPTCAPTRSALMTGRHEFKNGVTHTILERERMSLESVTLAEVLKQSGYTTGIFGKWHLGDEDAYQPQNRGFEEVFIHGAGGIGQKYPGSCADAPPNRENVYFDPVIKHNGTFVQTAGFCTDIFFRQGLGWINEQRRQQKPFFAYIATNAPHEPYIAPERYKKPFLEQGLDKNHAGFYGMIVNIDENVGLLMQKMEQWQLEDDTLLIFMTDNGSASHAGFYNAGMKGYKGSVDEGGSRVPAFFHWKDRIPAGVDVGGLTAHIDLFPTIAELTGSGLPANGQVEGRSLIPLFQNPKELWKDRFLITHCGRWEKGVDPDVFKYKHCAVRSERFRFVNNRELYHMRADPGQSINVAERYPEVVKEMRSAYEDWWSETRPLMVNENAVYEGPAPFIKQYNQQVNSKGIPPWIPPVI